MKIRRLRFGFMGFSPVSLSNVPKLSGTHVAVKDSRRGRLGAARSEAKEEKTMIRGSIGRVVLLVVGIGGILAVAPGCSSSDDGAGTGTGDAGGQGGGGSGGKATGGSGSGGRGSGGVTGTGGKGSGGSGGQGTGGFPIEAGTDGGCVLPHYFVYRAPGCGGAVTPVCIAPPVGAVDGGLTEACACNGMRILGSNGFTKPYRHLGECTDSGSDSGADSGKDAH
jgi:hypothetical protein